MTDVLGKLLSLPKTSQGFTAHRSSVFQHTVDHHERLGSHPHKTPRLDHDSDSGSAYRSRDLKGKAVERNGPIRIQIQILTREFVVEDGPRCSSISSAKASSKAPNPFAVLRYCTRLLLTRGSQSEMLPASFESIYTTCCSQVRIPGQGEKLYEMLVMEIDQCNRRLLRELEASRDSGKFMDWLGQFVQVCEWFESKVVRLDQPVRMHFRALITSLLVSGPPTVFVVLSRSRFYPKGREATEYPVCGWFPLRVLGMAYTIGYPRDLAFTTFKRKILNDAPIVDCIRGSVLEWLNRERAERSAPHPQPLLIPLTHCRSAHSNRNIIRNLVSHLLLHDVYTVIFERYILEQTLSFYTTEARDEFERPELSAEQFLVHVTKRTGEERERAEAVYGGTGETVKVVQACRRGLLETRLDWLAKGGARVSSALLPVSDLRCSYWPTHEYTGYGPTPLDLCRIRGSR